MGCLMGAELFICFKPDFTLLSGSTFSCLIVKDGCGKMSAGSYIMFIDKNSYRRIYVVNRGWNNFQGFQGQAHPPLNTPRNHSPL